MGYTALFGIYSGASTSEHQSGETHIKFCSGHGREFSNSFLTKLLQLSIQAFELSTIHLVATGANPIFQEQFRTALSNSTTTGLIIQNEKIRRKSRSCHWLQQRHRSCHCYALGRRRCLCLHHGSSPNRTGCCRKRDW